MHRKTKDDFHDALYYKTEGGFVSQVVGHAHSLNPSKNQLFWLDIASTWTKVYAIFLQLLSMLSTT